MRKATGCSPARSSGPTAPAASTSTADEDFDTRIWHFVDWLARGSLLGQCALAGEGQGVLSVVVKNYWEWRHVQAFNPQCSDGATDHWPITLIALENELGAQARKHLAKWVQLK